MGVLSGRPFVGSPFSFALIVSDPHGDPIKGIRHQRRALGPSPELGHSGALAFALDSTLSLEPQPGAPSLKFS